VVEEEGALTALVYLKTEVLQNLHVYLQDGFEAAGDLKARVGHAVLEAEKSVAGTVNNAVIDAEKSARALGSLRLIRLDQQGQAFLTEDEIDQLLDAIDDRHSIRLDLLGIFGLAVEPVLHFGPEYPFDPFQLDDIESFQGLDQQLHRRPRFGHRYLQDPDDDSHLEEIIDGLRHAGQGILGGMGEDKTEVERRALVLDIHQGLLEGLILDDDRSHHLRKHRPIMERDDQQTLREFVLGNDQRFAVIVDIIHFRGQYGRLFCHFFSFRLMSASS